MSDFSTTQSELQSLVLHSVTNVSLTMRDFVRRGDTLMFLTDWIDFRSVGKLDIAIADRELRILWLQHLRTAILRRAGQWQHGHSSLRWVILRGIQVPSITISESLVDGISDQTFKGINIPKLSLIILNSCKGITDDSLTSIINGCPLLEQVSLDHCRQITNAGIIAIAQGYPQLEMIHMESCGRVNNEGVIALGRGCPKLKEVNFSNCQAVGDNGLIAIAEGCPLLIGIYLNKCEIFPHSLTALAKGCPLLETVDLGGCRFAGNEGLLELGKGCRIVKGLGLKDMFLGGDHEEEVQALFRSSFPLLERLDISENAWMSNATISAVAQGCPLLNYINLPAPYLQDVGIVALAQGCPLLQTIAMSCCLHIGDASLIAIGNGCHKLEMLSLRNCATPSEGGIAALAQGCPLLQMFHLTNNQKLTDASLAILGNNCPLLEDVDVSNCERVTDKGISALASKCPVLNRIGLASCKLITVKGILALASSCPVLVNIHLNTVGRKLIKSEDVRKLKRDYPRLTLDFGTE